jgi:hypothetical protein
MSPLTITRIFKNSPRCTSAIGEFFSEWKVQKWKPIAGMTAIAYKRKSVSMRLLPVNSFKTVQERNEPFLQRCTKVITIRFTLWIAYLARFQKDK